jgi:hypothetical protein
MLLSEVWTVEPGSLIRSEETFMRKRLITAVPRVSPRTDQNWLDLGSVATVEVTSETKDHPVESALLLSETGGWRASQPGTQIIRLLFDQPLRVKRISLVFEESENTRTQEFVLRWSSDSGRSFLEIVRQQWNFSPPGTVQELEDYLVDLTDLTVMELEIIPDKSGGEARASLESMRLA